MNAALVHWLMAPDAEPVPLTLEDFLHRPEWQQDAACRGQGVRTWFSGAPGAAGPRQGCLRGLGDPPGG